MNLKRTIAPVSLPVSLAELKSHLRIDYTTDDVYLTTLISVATERVEDLTDLQLMTATYVWQFDSLPALCFEIPKPPLQSLTFQYYDVNDTLQTFTDYRLDTNSTPGIIELGDTRPNVNGWHNAYKLTFVCGYTSNVPYPILHAIKMLCGHFYEHRESVSHIRMNSIPEGIECMLASYRVYKKCYLNQ